MTGRTDQRHKVKAAALRGTWRIVETDLWDVEALDLIEPAHLTFTANGLGELQLIAIGAAIDYRISERDRIPFVEFSWAGYDDGDATSGRGWACLEPGGALKGRLFIHQGDESGFTAYRAAEEEAAKRAPKAEPSTFRLQRTRARRARR